MNVTIKSIAEHAGVSISTVSRVINAPETVNAETRERVLEVIERFAYRPNSVARSLSSKRTRTVGLIVPSISDFFVSELYRGVNLAASKRGMKVILFDSDSNQSRVTSGLEFMKAHNVEGIIYSSDPIAFEQERKLLSLNIPVVLVLTESSASPELAAFKVDEVQAVFDAVRYLVSRGHRNIGMISGNINDEQGASRSRLEGYELALNHHGLPISNDYIAYGNFRYSNGYAAMKELLEKRTTSNLSAVIAAGDEMAIGAMRCISDHGLKVPDDISVIGFDDLPIADMVSPKLTTVRQPFQDIGSQAVNYLLDVIEGKQRERNGGVHYLPYQIVGRESVSLVSSTFTE